MPHALDPRRPARTRRHRLQRHHHHPDAFVNARQLDEHFAAQLDPSRDVTQVALH